MKPFRCRPTAFTSTPVRGTAYNSVLWYFRVVLNGAQHDSNVMEKRKRDGDVGFRLCRTDGVTE